MRVVAKALKKAEHALIEHRVPANGAIEFGQLIGCRQIAVQQEVRNLEETGALRQLLDRVSPIHEYAFFAIDERYIGRAAARCAETGIVGKHTLLRIQL